MSRADELLNELANAIIAYRVSGQKDFEPVNNALKHVDQYRQERAREELAKQAQELNMGY